ncbi:hypothetical protein CLIB1423_11S01684 [[Candida] railenensis]|uniref:DUF1993 domain-containing protein n=1 Tax=[Candida] railenensis TaxID=45579 RepID=A0A9P0QRP3_9ASCO|nr:hypothetical protein CLIB1423_11S01684 [[Candida] railenensis]
MAHSLYDSTIVMAKGALTSLDRIITQAEKHENSATFFTSRLTEDMNPLPFQVHYATFSAQAVAAALAGHDYEEPEEDLDSYEKMHARINEAIEELDKADKESVNSDSETITTFYFHERKMEVPVKSVVCLKNMPNVYFHVSMAYAILRKEGVPLGKRDWSRGFVTGYV